MTLLNRLSFFCTLAALAVGYLGFAQRATAVVIYQENFDTSSSLYLNGLAPDVDNNGGGHTWVAYGDPVTNTNGYKESGVLPSAGINQGAYLPFVPVANNTYTLSASFTGITTTQAGNTGWYAFGFGKGVPTNPQGGDNRFISSPTFGRAWMLFRGNTAGGTNNVLLGNAGSGTASTTAWAGGTPTNGGDMNLKIVLDTTPATFWKATFYAQRPGDPDTLASAGALTLLINPADIGAIGFARTTNSTGNLSGNITTFKLESADAPLLPGDVNGDLHVDINDFNIIRDHLFQSGTRSQGDLTNDGFVDFSDFRAWKSAPASGAGANVIGAAVPEPASALLAMIATAGCFFAGRRRRVISSQQNL